jgi:taurine dioxygenase
MSKITVRNLRDDLSYGSIIEGVSLETLQDSAVRAEINDVFERRGMIVFTGCEPSAQLHVAISNVFGPLKDHPTKTTARVDQNSAPGVIDMHYQPPPEHSDVGLVQIGGRKLANWSNWHFDHCYNDELNLAGVLRSVVTAPEGGLTGFADGIQMYQDLSPELRAKIERYNVVYTLDVRRSKMRFGRPRDFKEFGDREMTLSSVREGLSFPRAMHPAVWTRPSGEKVLHVSPWMAVGLENNETVEGDALLEAVCQEMIANVKAYWHKWQPDHMVVWDNRRLLHAVSGCDPKFERRMQRTTIKGDYGLGYFEDGKKIGEVQREFVA